MLVFGLTGFFAFGGNEALSLSDSTSKALKKQENSRPRTATIMSAVLPGAGQVYNRKYWKVPVIYGVMGGLGYLFLQNNAKYQDYHKALLYRYDNDPGTVDKYDKYSDDNLIALKTQYRKYRDLSAVGIGIVYVFNIIDANVDAHLYKFEEKMSDDVSLRIKPYNTVSFTNKLQFYNGLTVQLKFR